MPDNETEPSTTTPAVVQPVRVLRGPTAGLHQDAGVVAWSPNGQQLAADFGDRSVRLWRVESGDLVHILEGHRGEITAIAWSPDGQRLASSSKRPT